MLQDMLFSWVYLILVSLQSLMQNFPHVFKELNGLVGICKIPLYKFQLSALLQEESLPMAVAWDIIGIFPSFLVMNLVHLKRNGHRNAIGGLMPDRSTGKHNILPH